MHGLPTIVKMNKERAEAPLSELERLKRDCRVLRRALKDEQENNHRLTETINFLKGDTQEH